MNNDLEQICFQMIVLAGESRSKVFEAIKMASEGKIQEAIAIHKDSYDSSVEAHKIQMELLKKESQGNSVASSILLVHAQDILMATSTERELGLYIIKLYDEIEKLKSNR